MPSYSNSQPPVSLAPGDVGFSFSSEAVPGSATAGSQFAVVYHPIGAQPGFAVRWQTLFGTSPTAINISLQGAVSDVDGEYKDIDVSTNVSGEARTVTGVQTRFLRVRVNSSTVGSGAGLTAKVLI